MTPAPKYIDPLSDLGLKLLFSPEDKPENLRDLLNAVLPPDRRIVSLRPLETEKIATTVEHRTVIYDLSCEDQYGRKFIIEIQRRLQLQLRDRLVLYGSRQISRSMARGESGFDYPDVVVVAILDYAEPSVTDAVYHAGLYRADTRELWSSKLAFTVVNLGNFHKSAVELASPADDWMYLLKNLPTMIETPARLQTKTFDRFISDAEYAKLSDREKDQYDRFWEEATTKMLELRGAEYVGTQKGIEQEKRRAAELVVRRGRAMGLTAEQMAELADVTVERVREIIAAHDGEG